jgi:hypothetical protein
LQAIHDERHTLRMVPDRWGLLLQNIGNTLLFMNLFFLEWASLMTVDAGKYDYNPVENAGRMSNDE